MDSSSSSQSSPTLNSNLLPSSSDKESLVDPFLVEALQNPRHRLTILHMELDIQRFLQNMDQQLFEFQYYPTSYLRLAAHRVAQHYSLQTLVHDNAIEGLGNIIIVRKIAESRYPSVLLSDLPPKISENANREMVKIAIMPRPSKDSIKEANEMRMKRSQLKTVEERKEDYDRARARIFNSSTGSESDDITFHDQTEAKKHFSSAEVEVLKNEPEKIDISDGYNSSRVAIFRDMEKDRTDPDYDRSYDRYIKNLPNTQSLSLGHFNMQKIQVPFVHYDTGYLQLGQMPMTQASIGYRPQPSAVLNPFSAMGVDKKTAGDTGYMQWPMPTMMYAQSYEHQFRHAVYQAPFVPQARSYDYYQNY